MIPSHLFCCLNAGFKINFCLRSKCGPRRLKQVSMKLCRGNADTVVGTSQRKGWRRPFQTSRLKVHLFLRLLAISKVHLFFARWSSSFVGWWTGWTCDARPIRSHFRQIYFRQTKDRCFVELCADGRRLGRLIIRWQEQPREAIDGARGHGRPHRPLLPVTKSHPLLPLFHPHTLIMAFPSLALVLMW